MFYSNHLSSCLSFIFQGKRKRISFILANTFSLINILLFDAFHSYIHIHFQHKTPSFPNIFSKNICIHMTRNTRYVDLISSLTIHAYFLYTFFVFLNSSNSSDACSHKSLGVLVYSSPIVSREPSFLFVINFSCSIKLEFIGTFPEFPQPSIWNKSFVCYISLLQIFFHNTVYLRFLSQTYPWKVKWMILSKLKLALKHSFC